MRRVVAKLSAIAIVTLAIAIIAFQVYSGKTGIQVYISSGLRVFYEPKLLGGTEVEIDVKGFDGMVVARLYAPTTTGFKLVGGGGGAGRAEVDITGYINEARNHTRILGWNPDRAGPSLLAHILMVEDKGRGVINITTQTVSIPIIPGLVEDKRVKVEVTPNPLKVTVIKAKPGVEVKQPPDRVGEACIYYPGPGGGYDCYYWELNQTLYEDKHGIPMLMTGLLELNDAENIKEIINLININLYTMEADYISFDIGLAITASLDSADFTLHTPGPGFTIYRTGDAEQDNLFSLLCWFYSDILSYEESECKYMGVRWDVDVGEYSYYAVVATGFVGDVAYSEYLLIHESCFSGFCEREVLNTSHAVWAAPRSSSEGKILPWQYVDDYAFDGENISGLASIIRDQLQPEYLPVDSGGYTSLFVDEIIVDVESSLKFAVGIPVGALILLMASSLPGFATVILPLLVVGVELGVTEVSVYSNLGYIIVDSITESTYYREYYEVTNYYVSEEEAEYPIPVVLFIPGST